MEAMRATTAILAIGLVVAAAGCGPRVEGAGSASPSPSAILEGPTLLVADPIVDGVDVADADRAIEIVQADAWLAEQIDGHSARLVAIRGGDSKAPGTRVSVVDYTSRKVFALTVSSGGAVLEHGEAAQPDHSAGEQAAAASIALADPDVAAMAAGIDLRVNAFAAGKGDECWRCVAVFLVPASGQPGAPIIAIVELSTGETVEVIRGS